MKVKFWDVQEFSKRNECFQYAVIFARYQGKWVFCRHRDRITFESPGGHWEQGESILETAKRELYEETGASDFELVEICPYSVEDKGIETFGMLYYANIWEFGFLPESEMAEVLLFEKLPEIWTYPDIQPKLLEKIVDVMGNKI